MQNITTEGNWVQGIWDLTVLFFTTACEPTITSLQKIENKSVCFHGTPRGTQRFLFGPTLPPAECKYQFQAWGECDLNTALKTRTGSLKRALHNADCQKTVTISKPCGKLTKSKPQGRFLSLNHNFNLNGLRGSGRIFRCANFPQGSLE